jgi:hypothetical protein
MALLQQPAEALAGLPRDTAGNMVRWVQALERGLITPRSSLQAGRAELQARGTTATSSSRATARCRR